MDVCNVLHMKEGRGATSYAKNSTLQKKSLESLKQFIIDAAVAAYASAASPGSFLMADLGCSSGPNALSLAGDIVEAIAGSCTPRLPPEFAVYLNDLPSNDFNALFASCYSELLVRSRRSSLVVFVAGVPGSFYGRLFPTRSLHFICSCYSLHWLSQVNSTQSISAVKYGNYADEGEAVNNVFGDK